MEEKEVKKDRKKAAPAACPVTKKCGSCVYQGIPYSEQLKKKKKEAARLLKPYCEVKGILGMDNPYEYRNKVHAVFARLKNGTIVSGTYEANSHRVVPVDFCMIENQKADEIIGSIRTLAKSFKIKIYDEDTGYGLLRHVLVRVGHHSGQLMVVLVLASPIMPSKNNFVKALLKLHPEITTIVVNVNEKRTSMILGEKEKAIYGKGYIEDTLCGLKFRISPKSFYQINTEQTEVLYRKAIRLADLKEKERVLDAYCGIGTIGMAAAKHAKEVIGVELNPDAVKDAIANARANGIKNIRFYQNDAGRFMTQMATEEGKGAIDVVFMDPPRAGSDEAFMSSVVKLAPKKVVYVSCNPETLAKDLGYFTKNGYEAREAWAVDMFPWTSSIESIVLLSHKSPDSVINVKVEFGEGEGKVPLDAIAERAKKYQPKPKVTYKMIQEYVEKKYGYKVHTAYIAEVKRSLGLTMYDAPNAVEELKQPRKHPPKEKVEAIKDALKYFEVI